MDCNALSADEALERIAQILGCKWSVKILRVLGDGERRPSELLREWDEMAPKVLHRCLNRLECDGLIAKETFAEVPLRTEYTLTAQGREFVNLLESARSMSNQWSGTLRKVAL